ADDDLDAVGLQKALHDEGFGPIARPRHLLELLGVVGLFGALRERDHSAAHVVMLPDPGQRSRALPGCRAGRPRALRPLAWLGDVRWTGVRARASPAQPFRTGGNRGSLPRPPEVL